MTKKQIELFTNEEESLLLFVGMTFATPQMRVDALRKVADRLAQTAPKDSPASTTEIAPDQHVDEGDKVHGPATPEEEADCWGTEVTENA